MGQAANAGLEVNGLPRGYQPGDMPPTPQQKGAGSIRMYDDDGTWSRQTSKPAYHVPPKGSGDGPEQLLGRKPLTSASSEYSHSERGGMGLSDLRPIGLDGSYAGSRDGGDVGWSTRPPTEAGGRSVGPRLDSFASSVAGETRQGPPSSVHGYSSQYQQLPHFQAQPQQYPGAAAVASQNRPGMGGGCGSGAGSNPSSSMPPSPSPSTVGGGGGGGYGGGFYRDIGARHGSFAAESVCCTSVAGSHLSSRPNHLGYTTSASDRQTPSDASIEWEAGSIVEIFSASAGRWYPAQVTQVQDEDAEDKDHEVLTMQFYVGDEAKQKSLYRNDGQLAALGSHTKGQLPPGFSIKASQSRPGQSVYLDETTGVKYSSPDLAWQVHFERLMQRPAAGCETVSAIPGRALQFSPPSPGAGSVNLNGSTLQQQQQQRGRAREDAGGAVAVGTMPCFPAVASSEPNSNNLLSIAENDYEALPPSDSIVHDLTTSGKIALPAFGDAMGSQAAYLTFERNMGADEAAARSQARMLAPTTATYPSISGSAPRKPPPPPRNPQLQTWQEDPFSEWRR